MFSYHYLKMMHLVFSCALIIGAGYGAEGSPATPTTQCGEPPHPLFFCIQMKAIFTDEYKKCQGHSDCEDMTCFFNEKGLMANGSIAKDLMIEALHKYGTENPDWQAAMDHIKGECFEKLPPQGIHLNCPAYDFAHCAQQKILKYAPAAQWRTSSECQPARAYAKSCPFCPKECLAADKPEGSCNACSPVQS